MTDLPQLGVGLGYRRQVHDAIMAGRDGIDWLEIVTDEFMWDPGTLENLHRLREIFTIVPHGLEMSVGSDAPLDQDYLNAAAAIADAVDAPWVSDHLCFTREGDIEIGNLTPVLRTRKKARQIAQNAQMIQDRLNRPFLLENIAYYVDLPGDLSEAEFISAVLDHCDCGLLLDLNNVVVNARNHGFHPREFVDALPLDRVVQVHLAGNSPHLLIGEVELDGHDAPVGDEVFALLEHLVTQRIPQGVLIERDDAFPEDFTEIIDELARARTIIKAGEER